MKDIIINALLIAPYLLFIPLIAYVIIIRSVNQSLRNKILVIKDQKHFAELALDSCRKKNEECCDALDKANARWNKHDEVQNTGTGLPISGGPNITPIKDEPSFE